MRLQRDRLLFRVTLESGKNQCVGKLAVPGYSDVAIPNLAIRDVANSRLGFCSR